MYVYVFVTTHPINTKLGLIHYYTVLANEGNHEQLLTDWKIWRKAESDVHPLKITQALRLGYAQTHYQALRLIVKFKRQNKDRFTY